MWAADRNQIAEMRLLLDAGADTDLQDNVMDRFDNGDIEPFLFKSHY